MSHLGISLHRRITHERSLLNELCSNLDEFADEITFSTVDPLRVSRAFLPLVKKSEIKKIIFISSVLASSQITFMMAGQFNAYSVAKAALNMYVSIPSTSISSNSVTGSHTSGLLLSSTRASAPPLSTPVRISLSSLCSLTHTDI